MDVNMIRKAIRLGPNTGNPDMDDAILGLLWDVHDDPGYFQGDSVKYLVSVISGEEEA